MKRFKDFASTFRFNALLSCSAAALLSACGGNIDDGSYLQGGTAAQVNSDTGASPVAPAAPTAAPVADTPVPQAGAATVTPSDTTTITPIPAPDAQSADATAPAPGQGAYQH